MECDNCLVLLQAGRRSAHHKEEWLREYDSHLVLAHGAHPIDQLATPKTREGLREFWRTLNLPEKSREKQR